jgi:hypothetical protein
LEKNTICVQQQEGLTALMEAAMIPSIAIVQLLIDAGAEVNLLTIVRPSSDFFPILVSELIFHESQWFSVTDMTLTTAAIGDRSWTERI